MPDITTHDATLHVEVEGDGPPVTVFAHGLTNSRNELAAFTPFLAGTKVRFDFRGHGLSSVPETGYRFVDFARDLDAVATAYGATRAVGTSLGAGAITNLISRDPDRFERIVFLLPAALDVPLGDHVLTQSRGEHSGGLDDRLVTGVMTECVVDEFEVVEVEHDRCAATAVACSASAVRCRAHARNCGGSATPSGGRGRPGRPAVSSERRRSVMSWIWAIHLSGRALPSRNTVVCIATHTGLRSACTKRFQTGSWPRRRQAPPRSPVSSLPRSSGWVIASRLVAWSCSRE